MKKAKQKMGSMADITNEEEAQFYDLTEDADVPQRSVGGSARRNAYELTSDKHDVIDLTEEYQERKSLSSYPEKREPRPYGHTTTRTGLTPPLQPMTLSARPKLITISRSRPSSGGTASVPATPGIRNQPTAGSGGICETSAGTGSDSLIEIY
ncbi:hypothetical protein M501DRAFT_737664 [Patellaria atrata CBS 101060]|uniref:Uncharacterized protein n=1 Tax=Patellaria atrata CBS 101060 TaxID=1346257 RepID=A0A9P4VRW5_9PEZI|nr:hypothetical protein M501DRAFT_737664 [Patellaria atrata CBS 101060]